MAKLTRNQRQSFRLFKRRQQMYEKRYVRPYYAYLRKTYFSAARYYLKHGRIDFDRVNDNEHLEKIFTRLYKTITLDEARIAYNEVIAPLEEDTTTLKQKDIINDMIDILNPHSRGLINMWQSLLDNFLSVRLTNRITMINNTTNERISRIIEQSIFDGLGAEETARKIRTQAKASLNRTRSRAIARTETVTSMNQGRYIAAQSSSLKMEKKWHPAIDARTRPSHRDMNDTPWKPLEEDFWLANDFGVLEPAKHPGDERLSASNVINCRCALTFRARRDENGALIPNN